MIDFIYLMSFRPTVVQIPKRNMDGTEPLDKPLPLKQRVMQDIIGFAGGIFLYFYSSIQTNITKRFQYLKFQTSKVPWPMLIKCVNFVTEKSASVKIGWSLIWNFMLDIHNLFYKRITGLQLFHCLYILLFHTASHLCPRKTIFYLRFVPNYNL